MDTATTTPTAEQVRELLRTRVHCVWPGGDEYRTLAAFTPRDVLLLANPQGIEIAVPRSEVTLLENAQFTCGECGARTNTRYADDRCAQCQRVWAQKQPVPSETCEVCGGLGAFYSPAAKQFACAQCHAKRGTLMGIGPEARVLEARGSIKVAECKGADTEDVRHRWFRIKGHRYHCKNCPARRFTDPPAGTMWAGEEL